jgi:hypothetical protein
MAISMNRAQRVALGATFALGAALLPLLSTGSAGAAASLCAKVTPAEMSSHLGIKSTKVTSEVNGSVTVCWYRVGANPDAAYIRIQSDDSRAGFNADRKSAAAQGESPKTDQNFGALPAFSTVLGSASYGYTFSVTVLKKSTEIAVGGVTTKLSNVEGLAKKLVAIN